MNINEQARAELLEQVNQLSDEEINKKPAENEWSIKQVMEHLILIEGAIFQTIHEQLANGEENHTEDKPIELTVNRAKKVQAPKFAEPSESFSTLEELKLQLENTHAQLKKISESASDSELEAKSYPNPAFGNLSLKQYIPFVGYHEKRHIEQIREIKQKLGLG